MSNDNRPSRFIIILDKDGDAESVAPEYMDEETLTAVVRNLGATNPEDAPFTWAYVILEPQ